MTSKMLNWFNIGWREYVYHWIRESGGKVSTREGGGISPKRERSRKKLNPQSPASMQQGNMKKGGMRVRKGDSKVLKIRREKKRGNRR